MKELKALDIKLLCDTFGEPNCSVCIFDPNKQLSSIILGEIACFDDLEVMRTELQMQADQQFILFNFSDNELLDIYCKENVLSILKFHQKNSAVFNPFATYYFLTHDDGSIACIQSPGARRISLSLKKEAGLSARIHRSVAQQGFKMGLQRFLADGSFTFYHKGQNPVERMLGQQEYDGFTINVELDGDSRFVSLKAYHEDQICKTIDGPLEEFAGRLLAQ